LAGIIKRKLIMTEQLTLFNFPATETVKPIHDPYWDEITKQPDQDVGEQPYTNTSPCDFVGEQVTTDTQKSAPQHDTHWIEKYWVKRSGNKYWYWRYMFMTGRKINRVYIGAVGSSRAESKKSAIEVAIEDGRFTPEQIKKMIRTWR
jgi:hypothetical protein